MAIVFKPEKHEYVSLDPESDIKWLSVTSFIGNFKQPFDADSVASKVSKSKKSKWFGMTPDEIKEAWLEGKTCVGVTAGASAPDILVHQVIARLQSFGGTTPREMDGVEEHMIFSMPKELRIP